MKKKLLISGLGGSLFPYLIEHLKGKYTLVLMDNNPIVKQLYHDQNVFIVPLVSEDKFEDEISKIIRQNHIDFYIPLIDEEILKAISIARSTGIKVLAPSEEFVNLALNKYLLMKKLEKEKISSIKTIMADQYRNDIGYPLFLKPNIGRGSRGIKKIYNQEEFEAYFILERYDKKQILVQPFIEGDEYTVSVTVNNLNQLISIVPKLVFTKDGITKHAKSLKHEKIESICKKIVHVLKPCGSFNVQLKLHEDEVFIFEINPRYSTTLVLSIESGVNEIDLNILNYDNPNIKYISTFKEVSLLRRWENVFYE